MRNRSEENRTEVGTRMGTGLFICRVDRLLNERKKLIKTQSESLKVKGIYGKRFNTEDQHFINTVRLNTLRTRLFKIFKGPFPGFLTILTL